MLQCYSNILWICTRIHCILRVSDCNMDDMIVYCGYMRNIYVPLVRSKCYNVTVTFCGYAFVNTVFWSFDV